MVHFSVAAQDLPTLARNGYLYDDSFYAFQIARSIAAGDGATFDGVTLTNGFQPLYVILLVPMFRVTGGDPVLPIHLALMMLSLFTVASAFLLYRILTRYVSGGVALASAAMWVLAPVVIRQTANGLETALSVFLLAASVYYYLSRVRDRDAPPRLATMVRLGALLGLAVLARLDQVFLVLALALDYLLVSRRRGWNAGGAAGMLATAAAVYSPWLAYGWFAVGRWLPESGAATRFLSLAYAPFFGVGGPGLAATGPDLAFIFNHIERAALVLKLSPVTHALFRTIDRAGSAAAIPHAAVVAGNVIGLALLAGFVVWLFRRVRVRGGDRVGELSFLVLFCVSLIAAYSLYVFGVFFYTRYLYPVYFVGMIFFGIAVGDALSWLAVRGSMVRRAAAAAAVLYVAAHVFMAFNCCFRSTPVYHFYDVARWVEQNTAPDETIGVFQSGTIGYLSNRRVVNLDGKVNGDALTALRNGSLEEYIHDAGVDVLMDHTNVIRLFLGDSSRFAAGRCFRGEGSGLPGWVGYRLADVAASPATAGGAHVPPRGSSSRD